MLALIILAPLGLIIPGYLKAGPAWGEWGAEEIRKLVGYIPVGIAKLPSLWNAPMPDYAFKASKGSSVLHLSTAYIISAIAGVLAAAGIIYLIGKLLIKKD